MEVYFIVLLQLLIAGGTHIVAKAVVADVDAATLTFFRSLISAAGFAILLAVKARRVRVERQDWKHIAFLGLMGLPINQFFYLYGISYSTAANGALLYATTPVFVLLLSKLALKEQITARKSLGVALAFAGVSVVIFERGVDFSSSYTFGNFMIVVAVLAWATFTSYGKPMILKYGALQTTALSIIAGTVIFFPFGLFAAVQFPFGVLTPAHGAGVLYLAVGTSIFGYLLWYQALGKIEASKLAVFSNGQPIVAVLLSLVFLDYTMTGAFVIGGIVTIVGVVITQLG
jgi:drug/metabolite transporter (DMT)-like permease